MASLNLDSRVKTPADVRNIGAVLHRSAEEALAKPGERVSVMLMGPRWMAALKSPSAVAGVGTSVADYGLERCCFSRVISSGDHSRTSVTSIHAPI
jgi:hypothetical protein